MSHIKQPAVAGLFYPEDPQQLAHDVDGYLIQAGIDSVNQPPPKAIIAPHAGYIYSGPIAGSAYAPLKQSAAQIEQVILVAPAHRVAVAGIALCSAKYFATPLGNIAVNGDRVSILSARPGFEINDDAFAEEHSIEVQLPFLQRTLNEFQLLPLLVGNANPGLVGEVLEEFWGGEETLIVISSDLSHYLDYRSAQEMDQEATHAIEALRPEALTFHHACGRTGISGLLISARAHGMHVHTRDLRNSGDTAGDKNRVVGYGAYHIY